jgi:hypothetical protein
MAVAAKFDDERLAARAEAMVRCLVPEGVEPTEIQHDEEDGEFFVGLKWEIER